MIRTTLFAAAGALLLTAPAAAQSISQGDLEDRYDRALAAGYKAMFLCSAIANAERNGATRTPESVMEWELSGIQSPFNELIGEMEHTIFRYDDGEGAISHVTVEYADNMPPRLAYHREEGGCAITPIGTADVPDVERVRYTGGIYMWSQRIPTNREANQRVNNAFGTAYGADARTTAVIVDRRGSQRIEQYTDEFGPFTPQRTWSVAKSIAATLVGAAVYRGETDVTASAGLGESEYDPRREITIDNGLRMATGRYSDTPGNRTDALYFGGATVDEVAVDWPLVNRPAGGYRLEHAWEEDENGNLVFVTFNPPREAQWGVFRYANNDTLIAQQAIEHTFEEHPPAALFEAIGMTGTVAETDWQGNYILSSQVWATAPDLLRLGQLHLNDGVLPDGTRILPEGWVEYISTPAGPQPGGSRGWGYGAGWWLLNQSEGIPADTFMAAGNRGQYIVVVPSRDVVIVRRGEDPAGGSGFDIVAFTRDVLAALED